MKKSYKIDVHQHFWKYTVEEFDWIGENELVLKRDFLPENLSIELSRIGYDGSIAVQARQTLEETRWLLNLADQSDRIAGIVGWVDLFSDKLDEQLEEFSKHKKFKGVRHVVQAEPEDDFIMQPDFLNGISKLEKYGLVYEILVFPRHLKYACQMVKLFPNQNFVLDHIAKPDIKNQKISIWAEDIGKLASFPNVSVKVSGMITEADMEWWKPDDFYPYLDIIWKEFGAERIMVGSDWPVCLLAASYSQVICLAEGYFEPFDEKVRAKVFGGNAYRIYQL